jgi:HAD superfamily hydrolase (TIGR01484 family)
MSGQAEAMRALTEFPAAAARGLRFVLTDIDDTLTDGGRLAPPAYGALAALRGAGLTVVPLTGRPAGWCDLIARQWPVDAVVGENGALYMRHLDAQRRLVRRYWADAEARAKSRKKLTRLGQRILAKVPGTALASDQPYREADLAIDYAEDVGPLPAALVAKIVAMFEAAGAKAKVSSIHVNGWFGEWDKLAMTRVLFREQFGVDLEQARNQVLFVGDSPNDQPLFAHFPHAVGVANVRQFLDRLDPPPAYVTAALGGAGFAELAAFILAARAE